MQKPVSKAVVVDSQIHIWGPNTPDRPWKPGQAQHHPVPFLAEQAIAEMDAACVDKALLVTPILLQFNNDVNLEAASAFPGRFKVIGRLDPTRPDAAEGFRRWRDDPRMLGVRFVTAYEPGLSWLKEGVLEPLWSIAEKARIPIVLRMDHAMSLIGQIAGQFPGLTIIIDHMGAHTRPGPNAFESLSDLLRLATYPNVNIKMSHLPVYSNGPFPYRDLESAIQRVLDAFGYERLIWGSDLTRLCPPYRYVDVVDHFRVGIPFLNEEQRRAILGLNALRLYRWD